MAARNLPVEIVSEIGTYLSNHELASISLVCKTWWIGTLPMLYHSVNLKQNCHVKEFSTVLSLGSLASAQTCHYVKELKIQLSDANIDESVLVLLEPGVPRLTHLSKLHWNLFYVPSNLDLVQCFQTQCPALCSVDILIPGGDDLFHSETGHLQFSRLLGFTNLIEFGLEIDEFPEDIATKCAVPLKTLLLNSPNLQSLKLYFNDIDIEYSLETLIASLGDELTLSHLRKLYLTGSIQLDDTTLYSPPGEINHPLRDFLTRHSLIEDIELECEARQNFDGKTDPQYFSLALPSLKNFTGPDHVCDQLIRSTVASQLETLTIQHSTFEKGVDFVPSKVFFVRPLPILRKLEIQTDEFGDALDIMKLIIPATEILKELCIPSVPFEYHRAFLRILSHAPMLQKVTMRDWTRFAWSAISLLTGVPELTIPGEENEASYKELLKKKMRVIRPGLLVELH